MREWGPQTEREAVVFVVELKSAVERNDARRISELVAYPMRTTLGGHTVVIRLRNAFVSNYVSN